MTLWHGLFLISFLLVPFPSHAADDIMDRYLSVPGAYVFVRPAPEGAAPDRVSLIVFEDFLCPVCYQTASELIPHLQDKYHDRLDVRFVGYPLIHPKSRLPACAYALAHEFGLSEQMQRALFRAQFEEQLDITSRDGLARVAHSIGLDPELFLARLDDGGGSAEVERNLALGESYHIDAVPGLILDGWIRVTTLSQENLETIIDGLLEKKGASP